MCRESLFTSLRLLQHFLSLYPWEKITFPLLHSPAGPVRALGKLLRGGLGRRHGTGTALAPAPLHAEHSPGCSVWGLSCPARSSRCPQAAGGWGRGRRRGVGKAGDGMAQGSNARVRETETTGGMRGEKKWPGLENTMQLPQGTEARWDCDG